MGDGPLAKQYRRFKTYLGHNRKALMALAELEQTYYGGNPFTLDSACAKYGELSEAVQGAVYSLQALSKGRYGGLVNVFSELDRAVENEFDLRRVTGVSDSVLTLESVTLQMKDGVGAKAANLAAAKNSIAVPVPDGFVISAAAFTAFIEENGLSSPLRRILSRIVPQSYSYIGAISIEAQALIMQATVPEPLGQAILSAFDALAAKAGGAVRVAVRSSAIGEDTEATFAGQYASVLNAGRENVIDAYKTVLASNYSAKAISYRLQYGLDDRETPMCALVLPMIKARASGVIYTSGSSVNGVDALKISAIRGLGEHLVDGSASPDTFLLDKADLHIAARQTRKKELQLVSETAGGVKLIPLPEQEREKPSIDDATAVELGRYALALERFFQRPQDIEWAVDDQKHVLILQSRPLSIPKADEEADAPKDFSGHPVLLSGGSVASRGIAAGTVFLVRDASVPDSIPENAILVAKTAASDYARVISSLKGIITDVGSAASHLSSVAREFGVPALLDTRNATSVLADGEMITLFADAKTVYQGCVEYLAKRSRPSKRPLFEGPLHRRMRRILDRVSPLNLVDPGKSDFSPEGCRTAHDIIRFTHEQAMRSMFGLTNEADEVRSIRLEAKIPLDLRLIDLGGGLRTGLTTCNTVTPDMIESAPLRALWRGFTHPGITWEGTINLDMKNFFTLMSSSAVSEFGPPPGGVSYALVSSDYMNINAKFGYHFATIDALCGETSAQNYVSVQFAGGAGSYYGKSLRVAFLGSVLKRLGFQIWLLGDLIEASIIGYDRQSLAEKLDQVGRLLASSRLLDMTLSNQDDIERLTEAFFRAEYDFLSLKQKHGLTGFYTHGGYWKQGVENGRTVCVQDGSRAGFSLSSGLAGVAGKLVGQALQDFLDNIEAYYYFPLAIAKDVQIADGTIRARVKPVSGRIDRAGGIAFGIRDVSNYFVLRVNALEDNVILFEYVNGKRVQRVTVRKKIESGRWCELMVDIRGGNIRGYLDGGQVMEYAAEQPVAGYTGLWTKADSVTYFDDLKVTSGDETRTIPFSTS